MVPIEQKDWTEEDRASKLGQNHPLDSTKRPFLKTLFADSGYQGPKFAKALAKVLPHLDIEIVKRSDQGCNPA